MGWQTVYLLDFTSLASQTLTGDGNHVIDGLTWVKYGSVLEVTTATIAAAAGEGLRFNPVGGGTTYAPNNRGTPGIWLDLTQIDADINYACGIRVCFENDFNNATQDYHRACCGIGPNLNDTNDTIAWVMMRGCTSGSPTYMQLGVYGDNTLLYGYADKSIGVLSAANSEMVLEVPDLHRLACSTYYGTGAADPVLTDMFGHAVYTPLSALYTIHPRNNLGIFMGAGKHAAANAFECGYGRLKVEAYYR
jgi:hypothetical protein